jgi:hypothetical protein
LEQLFPTRTATSSRFVSNEIIVWGTSTARGDCALVGEPVRSGSAVQERSCPCRIVLYHRWSFVQKNGGQRWIYSSEASALW